MVAAPSTPTRGPGELTALPRPRSWWRWLLPPPHQLGGLGNSQRSPDPVFWWRWVAAPSPPTRGSRGAHSAPLDSVVGGRGLLPLPTSYGVWEAHSAPQTPYSWWGGGCCPLSKNPRSRPPASIIGPSVSAPNDKSWTRRWRQYLVNGARRTIKGEVWTIRILQ